MRSNSSVKFFEESQTETGASPYHTPWGPKLSMQAVGRCEDAGTAKVQIQVSNVPKPTEDGHWILALEISLTLGTEDVSDGQQIDANWRHIRAVITELTGTNASLEAYLGG